MKVPLFIQAGAQMGLGERGSLKRGPFAMLGSTRSFCEADGQSVLIPALIATATSLSPGISKRFRMKATVHSQTTVQ